MTTSPGEPTLLTLSAESRPAIEPAVASNGGAGARTLSLLALRLLLIFATTYLLLLQGESATLPAGLGLLIAGALASNLAFLWVPPQWVLHTGFVAALILIDTLWVSAALLASGHFRPEFFYVYFLVLLVAGLGENLRLIALGALVICAAYVVGVVFSGNGARLLSSETLIRIPFLVVVAGFYGYLVTRVRREQRKAAEETAALVQAAEANRRLENEVAERKRAEQELSKLSRALEQSPAMVVVADTEGVVEYVNPRFCTTSGYRSSDVIGRNLRDLRLLGEGVEEELDPWEVLRQGGEWRGEARQETKGGDSYWAATSISPIHNDRAEATHLVAVIEDMSHVKQAEEALRKANDDLTKLNQMKSDFISTVSHELRTPLAAMKNALDILGTLEPAEEMEAHERFLGMAKRNVVRLSDLVNDILDISRIEAGRLEYRFASLELPPYLTEVVAALEAQAEAGGVELGVDCPQTLPAVWADANRIEQVLVNLLGNALKFTAAGGRVTLRVRPLTDVVELNVEDTGVGLSPENRRRIFEPFFQVDEALTRKVKGSGLGLAIAREMVRTHGGELALESEENVGSRFFFRLPLHSPRAEEMSDLEARFVEYRSYPFFSLLTTQLNDSGGEALIAVRLDAVGQRLEQCLPRTSDLIIRQPAHARCVVVLLGTQSEGADIVCRRLRERFESNPIRIAGDTHPSPIVLGPASYPDDGATAYELTRAVQPGRTEGEIHGEDEDPGRR